MRLSRIDMVGSMRLDRISVPAAAPAPHILFTGSTTKETFHAHLRHRRLRLDRLGSGKPLVISGATLVTPGQPATERDELIAAGPIAARITNMQAALAAAGRGVRSCLVMMPRSVHGQGERHGFVPQLIAAARAKGVSGYIGDGTSRWPAVHVKDAASLYRLAIEQAPAGAVLNAVGDEGVPVREIAEAIGRHLNLPARSLPAEEFGGMLVPLLSTDMPASSTITQELLGWQPTHPGLIEDIEQGHYFTY